MPRKRNRLLNCENCGLSETRLNVIEGTGQGSYPVDILFVQEFPDKDEDREGAILEGRKYAVFNDLIGKALSLLLPENYIVSYYIVNMIMCTPVDYFGGPIRKPLSEEISGCKPNVMKIFSIVKPKVSIFFGNEVKKYYKKSLRPNKYLTDIGFLVKQGGKNSPFFLSNARKLSEIIQEVCIAKV